MPANNIHVLTKDELSYFKKNYKFTLKDDLVIVSSINHYKHSVVHQINEKFTISAKPCRITLNTQALSLWAKHYRKNFSPVEVQNAINKLLVTYQIPSKKDLDLLLKKC